MSETRHDWRQVLLLLVAACAPLLLTASAEWPRLTGDEPHYVIMAESLRLDGDLDLAGDYSDGRLPWLQPQGLTPHVKPGAAEGSGYSFHGPGLAFLLLPFHSVDPFPPHGLRLLGVLSSFALGLGSSDSDWCERYG